MMMVIQALMTQNIDEVACGQANEVCKQQRYSTGKSYIHFR